MDFITDGNAQNDDSSWVFSSFPGPLQTVQSAELLGVVLSLQALVPVFVGIDNLNVFKSVFELLDGSECFINHCHFIKMVVLLPESKTYWMKEAGPW